MGDEGNMKEHRTEKLGASRQQAVDSEQLARRHQKDRQPVNKSKKRPSQSGQSAVVPGLRRRDFLSLVSGISDMIALLDDNGTILYQSPSTRRLLGYKANELDGKNVFDFFHPDDAGVAMTGMLRAAQNRRSCQRFESRIRRRDGSWCDVEAVVKQFGSNSGEAQLVVSCRDIGDYRRVEEALRQSEERLRAVFECVSDGLVVTDLDGHVLDVNAETVRRQGCRHKQELIGVQSTELGPEEERHMQVERRHKILKDGQERTIKCTALTRDGRRIAVELSSALVRDKNLNPIGFAHLSRDITERKRSEEALRESEENYRTLFEESRDAIYVTNQEGRFFAFNRAFADLFGYRVEEASNITVSDIYCDLADRRRFQRKIGQRGYVRDYAVRLRRSDGQVMECLLTATVRRSKGGDIIAYQGIVRDVTEWKRAQQVLRAYSHRLVNVQENERYTIACELHDQLGQSLTGMKLLLRMAGEASTEDRMHKLEEAQTLLDELTNRVRDLSLDLRPAMLDDLGLIPALVWHFERYYTHTNVRVSFKQTGIDRRLPRDIELATFRIVQEALTNVASHASVDQALVSLQIDDDSLHMEVRDRGVGFVSDSENVLFASGGLTGMRERAMALSGNLTVESAPGIGTHVVARLPLAASDCAKAE